MKRKGRTSQRTILFRQNVNRDNEEWAYFLEGYREWLMEWDMMEYGDNWHTAEDVVSEIFLEIVMEPLITNLRPNDSFRHTLIVLCKHEHRDFTKPWRKGLAEKLCAALRLTLRSRGDTLVDAALGLVDLVEADLMDRTRDGKRTFIDFDNAHTFAEAVKNTVCIGTDPYSAPEVASCGEISKQSDLYSLAMLLVERCPEKLRDCLEPVLRECLKPEPGDRPPSAAAVAGRLRRAKPPHHRFKAAAKWTAVAGGAILLGLVAVNAGIYFHRRAAVERKYGDRIEMKVNLRSGLTFLERGDLTNAVRRLRIARQLGSKEAAAKLEELRLRRH